MIIFDDGFEDACLSCLLGDAMCDCRTARSTLPASAVFVAGLGDRAPTTMFGRRSWPVVVTIFGWPGADAPSNAARRGHRPQVRIGLAAGGRRIRTLSVPGDGELWWGPLALGRIAGDRNAGAARAGGSDLSGKIADENGIP
jgi:hypothetical protein